MKTENPNSGRVSIGSSDLVLPLPDAVQVLIYDTRMTHSYWCDMHHNYRTMRGLMKLLTGEIKRGKYQGYRFLTIHQTQLGLPSQSGQNVWATWSEDSLEKEIRERMIHFYGQTDGSLKFPNTAEGDILKIVEAFLSETP